MTSMDGIAKGLVCDPTPDAVDAANLMAALAEGLRIRRRVEFFAWTQSSLQDLIPHGMLLCGLPRSSGGRMFFDYFHHVPIHPKVLARLCHPRQGLAAEMVDLWLSAGAEPLSIGPGVPGTSQGRLALELVSLGLGDLICHGIPNAQIGAGVHCFLGFVALPTAPTLRDRHLIELLVPHVFNAYCRALSPERQPVRRGTDLPDGEQIVTDREVEILKWVREGKSNQEIGMILNISPLTVKNHVQKILRKLQASNRAQAVSKAIALKLLGSSFGRSRFDLAEEA
jgi:transcriptional regulator EpsA